MYYRRKVILALLQLFEDRLEKIRIQKLLFLISSRQSSPTYDFVPYKYGCYSYSANADMTAMTRQGILEESPDYFTKIDQMDYLFQLKPEDKQYLLDITTTFGRMSAKSLMKYTYINFPFYAINSDVADQLLNAAEFELISSSKPNSQDTILFTIGYEGISLEAYLVRLLKNNVHALVDVRNNPLSMKYGFSKSQLKKFCENLGIQYFHFPELGILSTHRKDLNTQKDFDILFKAYRKTMLPKVIEGQMKIIGLLKEYNRIALTCFEADICQCHRKHLAEAVEKIPEFTFEVQHI